MARSNAFKASYNGWAGWRWRYQRAAMQGKVLASGNGCARQHGLKLGPGLKPLQFQRL
jgi:hypothetical protein